MPAGACMLGTRAAETVYGKLRRAPTRGHPLMCTHESQVHGVRTACRSLTITAQPDWCMLKGSPKHVEAQASGGDSPRLVPALACPASPDTAPRRWQSSMAPLPGRPFPYACSVCITEAGEGQPAHYTAAATTCTHTWLGAFALRTSAGQCRDEDCGRRCDETCHLDGTPQLQAPASPGQDVAAYTAVQRWGRERGAGGDGTGAGGPR